MDAFSRNLYAIATVVDDPKCWRPSMGETQLIPKVWGWEEVITNTSLYCLKRLFFKQGHRASVHYHRIKDERFWLQSGCVLLLHSEQDPTPDETGAPVWPAASAVVMRPGDTFHVPPGRRHMMFGLQDSLLLEVSTHHDDTDVVRLVPSA